MEEIKPVKISLEKIKEENLQKLQQAFLDWKNVLINSDNSDDDTLFDDVRDLYERTKGAIENGDK